jgi:hypothetical protein
MPATALRVWPLDKRGALQGFQPNHPFFVQVGMLRRVECRTERVSVSSSDGVIRVAGHWLIEGQEPPVETLLRKHPDWQGEKARQAVSHTPCSSQPRQRRQQELGEGFERTENPLLAEQKRDIEDLKKRMKRLEDALAAQAKVCTPRQQRTKPPSRAGGFSLPGLVLPPLYGSIPCRRTPPWNSELWAEMSWRSHGVRGLNQNRFRAHPELEELEQQCQEQT